MFFSLRHRKLSPWVAALAVAVSAFLVLGQVFHCCRINEAVAALFTHTLDHLEGKVQEEGAAGHPPLVTHHAACHGQGPVEEDGSTHPIQPDEPCLSEADLALEGVEPGNSASLLLFPARRAVHALPRPRPAPALPVPRVAGDLPPYLLTLRILV